ncbi:Uncharacterised protein [Mycobacteroides abscessus subsp. abscessus]|nr:Uncharacterised protein [Mycobacteroides abscessus subsp. abscessus]
MDVRADLGPRPGGEDGEGDAAGVEVDGVLEAPGHGGAAFALTLMGCAVVPHVLVDDEFVAAVEELAEGDRAVLAMDLGVTVDLDHRQGATGGGDGVRLGGVGLLPVEELGAFVAPRVGVDDLGQAGNRLV